jgi:hypothetical protein
MVTCNQPCDTWTITIPHAMLCLTGGTCPGFGDMGQMHLNYDSLGKSTTYAYRDHYSGGTMAITTKKRPHTEFHKLQGDNN